MNPIPPTAVGYTKRHGTRTVLIIELPPAVHERLTHPGRQRKLTTRCKPVHVLAVNENAAAVHRPPFGKAQVVHVGQIFESAALASEALGFDSNAVAIKLSTRRQIARRAGNDLEPDRITLRGVTLAYVSKEEAMS